MKLDQDINEWGIFMRLCHENALMVNKMQSWLREYGVEKQNPKHFDRALKQTLGESCRWRMPLDRIWCFQSF